MSKEEILKIIGNLAESQGFYFRLLKQLTDEDLNFLVDKNFKDATELVMFLEGC